MKKITNRAVTLLLIAALIIAGLALYTIRYVDEGRDWALAFSRANSGSTGELSDRNGVLLASFDAVDNRYAADAATRIACYHVTGDYWGRSGSGALTWFWDDMHNYSLLTGTTHSSAMELKLNIDASLCRTAYEALDGQKGAILLMNYRSGEIYAMLSVPSFDPSAGGSVSVSQSLNRATRWLSAPGSAFKIVTLSAALQNLEGAETRDFECTGGVYFGEHQRTVTDYGGAVHGSLSLRKAFIQSCNSTFAILASEMGDKALRRTAESFGVGDDFIFRDLVVENSAFSSGSSALRGADLAWTGVGQNQLALTPLHMCMIAASVANDGVMMEPRLLMKAVSPRGEVRAAFEPIVYRNALPESVACTVRA